jgi:hypothetical protein
VSNQTATPPAPATPLDSGIQKPTRESRPYGLSDDAANELRAIDRMVALFQRRRLPWQLWSHRTHLIVGLRYLIRYGFSEGLLRIRQRIRDYNEAVGIANDSGGGYHETATVYYMWALAQFRLRNARVKNRYVLFRRLWEDPVSDPDFLLRSYSPERLREPEARTRWIEPDRIRLPRDTVERLLRASDKGSA